MKANQKKELPKILVKYVRHKSTGQRIGTVVAISADQIGWSKLCKRDMWNRDKGLTIAMNRAEGFHASIPTAIRKDFNEMKERAKRYYK